MKTLFCASLLLALASASAFAAPAKGKVILSCSAALGEDLQLKIYANPDGSVRASLSTESFGGSFPTFHYDVKKSRGAEGYAQFTGKNFSLKLKADKQADLKSNVASAELDCR